MKFEESYTDFDSKIVKQIKAAIPASFVENMAADGTEFSLPAYEELELKIKYDAREDGGSLTLKFSWDNGFEQEEENEEDTAK